MIDHYEKVNLRREAMLREWSEKEQVILKQIAALKQSALDVRGEADKLARNHHIQKSNDAKAAAAKLEDDARRLTNVGLARLRAESNSIRMNLHPELAQPLHVANLRQQNAQADHTRKLCDDLTAAKGALYENLVKLSTKETLRLAQAVVDAETAADVEHESTALAILAAHGYSKVAA
jgi:hypothetical protein